jgi:nitrosocyanin
MVGGAAGFEPATITVDKGEKVIFTVGNTTEKTHGFTIDGYGVRKEVPAHAAALKVELEASKSGTYRIRCQLHPAHQTATLVVQ